MEKLVSFIIIRLEILSYHINMLLISVNINYVQIKLIEEWNLKWKSQCLLSNGHFEGFFHRLRCTFLIYNIINNINSHIQVSMTERISKFPEHVKRLICIKILISHWFHYFSFIHPSPILWSSVNLHTKLNGQHGELGYFSLHLC